MGRLQKIGIIIALVAISAWLSWEMLSRTSQELLWGYRPLGLFLSVWALLVLGRRFLWEKYNQDWDLLGYSTLSGVLLALGFPGIIPFPFLMFIAFVPLLLVEHKIAQRTETPNKKVLFRYAYNTFVIWNILSTYWVANTAFFAGIVAIWLNALFMCIPLLAFHQTKKILPRFTYFSLVVYWLGFEYVHFIWEISWPWLSLGNSFAQFPVLVQWYSYTGVFGGTLWVLAFNILLFKWWLDYEKEKSFSVKSLLRPTLVLSLPIILSLIQYYTYEEQGEAVEVLIVQPNFEPHYGYTEYTEAEQLDRFLDLAAAQIDENTAYLVFPETSFGIINATYLQKDKTIRKLKTFLEKYPKLKLVTGLSSYQILEGPEQSNAPRIGENRDGSTFYYEIQNSAVQLEDGKTEIPFYLKSKLVPGAEMLPYKDFFFFLKPLVDQLGGSMSGHATQKDRAVFSSSTHKIAPVICYESVYGGYMTGYVDNGAAAIFVMTNDGWWDNTAGHRQHLYFSSLRAIETRRSIARSANTGISAFINQRGDILQPTKYEETIARKGTIYFNQETTFYTNWKDVIGRIGSFLAILLLLNTIAKGVTGTKK